MQKKDKVLLASLIPVLVVIVAVAIVLGIAASCPRGKSWHFKSGQCRPVCSGGQAYDAHTDTCACPADRPVWNKNTQRCEGECDVTETWNAETGKCDPPLPATCVPPPTVDARTGEIENATHFDRKNGTCDAGTLEELTQLCRRSLCLLPGVCTDGERWDGFDGEKCYKTAECSLQPCDAPYCTSPTVLQKLGTIKKQFSGNDEKCENPRQSEVASWCNSLPDSKFVLPECATTVPQAVMSLAVNNGSTVSSIRGTVSHPLINGTVDLTSEQTLMYEYALNGTDVWLPVEVTGKCSSTLAGTSVCANFLIQPQQTLTAGTYLLDMRGFPAWDTSLPLYTLSAPVPVLLTGGDAPPQERDALKVTFDTLAAQEVATNARLINEKLSVLHASNPTAVMPELTDNAISLAFTPLPTPLPANVRTDVPLLVSCLSSYCKSQEDVPNKLVVLAWKPVQPVACGSAKVVKYEVKKQVASPDGGGVIDTVLVGPTQAQGQPSAAEVNSGTLAILDLVRINQQVTYYLGSYMADSLDSITDYASSSCKSPWFQVQVNVGAYSAAFCQSIPAPFANSVPPYLSLAANGVCTWDTTDASRDFYCTFAWPGTSESPKPPGLHPTQLALFDAQYGCVYVRPSVPEFDPVNTWTSPTCGESSIESCFSGEPQTVTVTCRDTVRVADKEMNQTDLQDRLQAMVNGAPYYNYNNFDMSAILKDQTTSKVGMDKVWDGNYYSCGPKQAKSTWGNSVEGCSSAADSAPGSVCKTLAANANCGPGKNYCQPWRPTTGTQYERFRRCYRDVLKANTCQDEKEKRKASPCCDQSCLEQELSECCNCRGTFVLDPNGTVDNRGYCVCAPRYAGARCEEDVCGAAFKDKPECSPDNSASTGCCIAHLGTRCQEFKTQESCPTQSGECKWNGKAKQCERLDVCSQYKTAATCNNLDCRWDDNTQTCEGVRFKCQCNPDYYRIAEARPMDMMKDCQFFTKGTIATTPYNPSAATNTTKKSTCSPMDGEMRNKNCMIDPYTCKCPQPCQPGEDPMVTQCIPADPYVCRRNDLPTNASPRSPDDGTATKVNPLTGCVDQCSQHIPNATESYKYYNPEVNDFRCRPCHVGGKCEELQTTLNHVYTSNEYLDCYEHWTDGSGNRVIPVYKGPPNMGRVPSNPACLPFYDMRDSVSQNPIQYCPDCCFYRCSENSKSHHWCDDGKWPPY